MASRAQSEVLIPDVFEWPLFPFLPMKNIIHYTASLRVGFLFSDDVREQKFKIYLGPLTNDVWRDKRPSGEIFAYRTLEAMLDDGWVVD